MDTKQFARLRERANYLLSQRAQLAAHEKATITQSDVAKALGVTLRTAASWERVERDLSLAESRAIRDLFLEPLLRGRLGDMCQRAFEALPSEIVTIWLVQDESCVLLPFAKRYHDVDTDYRLKARREIDAAESRIPLMAKSLTNFPLRSGEIVRAAGEGIERHTSKRHPGRAAFYTRAGVLESMLHVPAFTPSPKGPQPVLLLSLQNKLNNNGRVCEAEPGVLQIFDARDEEIAKKLAAEFRDELLEDLDLLEMFGGP